MNSEAKKIIRDFLNFSGERTAEDFRKFLSRIAEYVRENPYEHEARIKLNYVLLKIEHGLRVAMSAPDQTIYAVVEDTEDDIEKYFNDVLPDINLGKIKPRKREDNGDLGKLVDEGKVPTSRSRADNFWNDRLKVIFTPTNKQLRNGLEIPKSYQYDNLDFLIDYYGLHAIEFGNWLSQQDRKNYLSGLGLSLFDLYKTLGFNPKDISLKGKVTIAFGARGRGAALAHFEPDTFAINITRYSRPSKGSTLKTGFDRTKLLTASGGIGSLAHEYGHALDYYAGTFIEKHKTGAISDGRSLRTTTNKNLLKKQTVSGLMERILDRIIWVGKDKHSAYYKRLISKRNKTKMTDYYFRRNELFARAFEVYFHYKMQKKKYKNIFLAETKYDSDVYLTLIEMRSLEKDIDALVSTIKRKL